MAEETPAVKEPETLPEMLQAYSGAPSQESIEKWKLEFGDIYVSAFSETELFIFRSVNRPEWIALQARAADPEEKMDQFQFEEAICNLCVLWKSITLPWNKCKAGIPSAIQEQILQNSCFVTPQVAARLCAKL